MARKINKNWVNAPYELVVYGIQSGFSVIKDVPLPAIKTGIRFEFKRGKMRRVKM